ncbi:DUF6586 family protein [Kushneria aurantia]|uniref:DUF6586 family protein n=1 Tax=Kushneria aurantia TaxID=504092 RepID=A0ABV6G6S8_9GAMM|nr:DUF6586 family protein [Kushneria aurantia]
MSDQGRTNQLLYQALLMLEVPPGSDEHGEARRMALEEGALSMLALALESLVREIAHTCRWPDMPWREVLVNPPGRVAEIEQLRELMARPDSWLSRLLGHIDHLHTAEGAARHGRRERTIATSLNPALGRELLACHEAFRQLLPQLRETSHEW